MNGREKAAIRKNLGFLVQNIDVNSIKHYLFEKYILTQEDMEFLSMTNHTTSHRNEVLILQILPKRGENAFKEFVKALELDGHFSHVVEMLQNTLLRVCNQSNQSVGFDEADGEPAYPEEQTVGASTLPEDTFEVLCEASPYLLHISTKGIALILKCDFLETSNIQNCAHKKVWGFNVIRQFGHGDDHFLLEAGSKAPSGPGLFYFKTTNMQDGSQILRTIKKYIDSIKNHNGGPQ